MALLVSVVVPTYNAGRYVGEAIESVLRQTYKNFELIVIDDGSTDNTEEVVKRYGKQVRYIKQKNSGIAEARNRGIHAARGELISFLDADDVFLKHKLERQVRYMSDHPDCAMVYGNYSMMDEDGTLIHEDMFAHMGVSCRSGMVLKELLLRCFIWTCTVVVKEEVFQKLGFFDSKFVSGQDYDMWMRIAAAYKTGCVSEPLSVYRQNPNSITHKKAAARKPAEILVVEKAFERFPGVKGQIPYAKVGKRMARVFFDCGYQAFHERSFSVARYHFARAFFYRPLHLRTVMYLVMSISRVCIP